MDLLSSSKTCSNCYRPIPFDASTCLYCGAPQLPGQEQHLRHPHEETVSTKWIYVLALFYGIDLIVCTVVNFLNYFRGLEWLFFTEAVLAFLTIIFIIYLWKDIRPLLQWKSFSVPKLLVYTITAVIFALLVNLLIKWLNKSIFNQDIHYFRPFRHLLYPRLSMIFLVAVLPAIFEELAYRGIILFCLTKLTFEKQAILISAFLFAVVHMSFISFFWLLPFAVWLGNIRLKENTIWYGIVIHFFFNLTACLVEFYEVGLL
ncbi:MAG TPA: CPBP family intramembrane glutamic endopeptidase [Chitinophagaceae bacterium]|jgi:membrane protease YdiL (CAAX protease family)|nr:CPBP family intramembrane glutamic endopeptidase [Chitinophagaceae bacterium]